MAVQSGPVSCDCCYGTIPELIAFPHCCGAYIVADFGHCDDHSCTTLTKSRLEAYLRERFSKKKRNPKARDFSPFRGRIIMAILNEGQNDVFGKTFLKTGFKLAQVSKEKELYLYTKEAGT